MHALIIKDLAIAADLDTKAMTAVRGGCYSGCKMPSSCMPSLPPCDYGYPSSTTTTTTVTVDQANNQCQNNPTGNGSAVFCGSIAAQNNQQGYNSIGSGWRY